MTGKNVCELSVKAYAPPADHVFRNEGEKKADDKDEKEIKRMYAMVDDECCLT